MKSENSQPDLLDLDAVAVTDEDREALWSARVNSRKMTTERYLAFLRSFSRTEPDRKIRGFPGQDLQL